MKDWNSYLKNIYESNVVMDNIEPLFMEDEDFSIEDTNFGIKHLVKGKDKAIECYQAKS